MVKFRLKAHSRDIAVIPKNLILFVIRREITIILNSKRQERKRNKMASTKFHTWNRLVRRRIIDME